MEIGRAPTSVISLKERGSAILPTEQWKSLRESEDFWKLVDAGILAVSFNKRDRPTLRAFAFIGRARCGHIEIRILEKTEGALLALVSDPTIDSFTQLALSGPSSEANSFLRILVSHFVRLLHLELSQGIEKKYVKYSIVTSMGGGQLDIRNTIKLWGKGNRNKLGFSREHLISGTPFNRVMLICIREIERLFVLGYVEESALMRARTASILLDAARLDALRSNLNDVLLEAHRLVNSGFYTASKRTLLNYASVLLSHESFGGSSLSSSLLPFCWIISLEKLFEDAIRNAVSKANIPGKAAVTNGNESPHPLVHSDRGIMNVHPDIVIHFENGNKIVLDVKYKDFEGSDTIVRSDLYQLISYALALDAKVVGLVYPGERTSHFEFGTLPNGCQVFCLIADVKNIGNAIHEFFDYFPKGISKA